MQKDLMTVEYYDGRDPDRMIGAVYVPTGSARACATRIGQAILKACGGDWLRLLLLDAEDTVVDEVNVFRKR